LIRSSQVALSSRATSLSPQCLQTGTLVLQSVLAVPHMAPLLTLNALTPSSSPPQNNPFPSHPATSHFRLFRWQSNTFISSIVFPTCPFPTSVLLFFLRFASFALLAYNLFCRGNVMLVAINHHSVTGLQPNHCRNNP
jgi:hypothetical protein